jgi:AraC family transcriptional regulator
MTTGNLIETAAWLGEANSKTFITHGSWEGISVNHCRVGSGESGERQHPEHQIVIPLAGAFTGGMLWDSKPRQVARSKVKNSYIIPAGRPSWSECDEEMEFLSIYLDPALLRGAAQENASSQRVELIGGCDKDDPLILQIGMALLAEAKASRAAGRLYVQSLANILAVHLLRNYTGSVASTHTSNGGLSGYRLRQVTQFIVDNLEQELSLAEIAEVAGMSTFHFARAFKETTGLAPHQYLTRSRIDRAKALLTDTRLAIVDVCFRVGFQSQSHFTTLFRRMTGLTPKAYRDVRLG